MDLPDEVLEDVLRRVPPRHLAAFRRVSKSWRAVIDGSGLVLAHLAPRPPRGIFINFVGKKRHSFFSRAAPTGTPRVGGSLCFLPDRRLSCAGVLDHRNGLLLYENREAMYVCNPMTRRWATVPPPPPTRTLPFPRRRVYLVYDPAVSLHYDVLFFPDVPDEPKPPSPQPATAKRLGKRRKVHICTDIENLPPSLRADYEHSVNTVGSTEWPPCSYGVRAFSSRTGQWEERRFIREGDAAAAVTVSEVWSDPCAPNSCDALRCYAVYWRGKFYLHCRGGFVMRFSLLEEKYLAIKTPNLDNFLRRPRSYTNEYEEYIIPYGYLAKSKQGVYYAVLHGYQLSVWVLHETPETCQMPVWELKHEADLKPSFRQQYTRRHGGEEINKSWTLDPREEESDDRGDHGWDSGEDGIVDAEGGINGFINCYYGMDFLGFHPYKEIVFLGSRYNGFAYYLGSSKLQYLGSLYPTGLYSFPGAAPTLESFIYTPCMDDLLPAHNEP